MDEQHNDHELVRVSELPDANTLPEHKIPSIVEDGVVLYDPNSIIDFGHQEKIQYPPKGRTGK